MNKKIEKVFRQGFCYGVLYNQFEPSKKKINKIIKQFEEDSKNLDFSISILNFLKLMKSLKQKEKKNG